MSSWRLILAWGLLSIAWTPAVRAEAPPDSALARLERVDPRLLSTLDPVVRAALARISPQQEDAIRGGAALSAITMLDGGNLLAFLQQEFGLGALSIPFFTIDSGGGSGSGSAGRFRLQGAVGQPESGVGSGGAIELHGGFWPADRVNIFRGDFEIGNSTYWSATVAN